MTIPEKIKNPELRRIAGKVAHSIPVDRSDAHLLLTTPDILDLGAIAHGLRTRMHGDVVCYGVNMNLNYTNICQLRCPLCAFSRDPDDPDAFVLSPEEIEKRAEEAIAEGVDEVHIVGGLHPELGLDYYEEILRRIRQLKADIFIVAFTPVEYDHFARLTGLRLEEVFRRLIDAGVNALPGGGAEIFVPAVREAIAPEKISGRRWLEIMRLAHRLGLRTNATLLYNHLESIEDIVDHLFQIRNLQEETGGFKTFVPLPFHEGNTKIQAKRPDTTGFDDIRIYAASRIILHNIPHLKALWMYVGEKMAQVLLRFGVDDISGTYQNEKIVHAAGARTPDYGTEAHLRRLIENAGLQPRRTNAGYE
jgi:aminodeoxyfutalosine synthase